MYPPVRGEETVNPTLRSSLDRVGILPHAKVKDRRCSAGSYVYTSISGKASWSIRKLSFIDPGVPAKVLPFNIDYSALQFLVTRRVGRRELIPNAPRC